MKDIHPDVINLDIMEIASSISVDNMRAAEQVVDAIKATFDLLACQPFMGTLYHPVRTWLKGIRMLPVTPYRNYLVFYRPLSDGAGVRILYVLHAARDISAFLREHQRQ